MGDGEQFDAVIIGAGIIGANLGFEMSKAGYRTLNIDKLPAAGYGSTSNSCAIIRTHYSTWAGVAMAYEGYFYWKNWAEYLEVGDESGVAGFIDCGAMYVGGDGRYTEKVLPLFDEIGVPYETWTPEQIIEKYPNMELGRYAPPKRAGDKDFWNDAVGRFDGAVYSPAAGYVTDPQLATHNLQRAAEAKGGVFRFNSEVTSINQSDGRVTGITLSDGTVVEAAIVVNVAGPHSFVVNEMAGIVGTMNIGTRALRHEVHHLPEPEGMEYSTTGTVVGDDDLSTYFRPEVGGHILLGSQDPDCDPQEWVEDPDNFNRDLTRDQWETQSLRLARRLPNLGIPDQMKGIVDLYDVSDDWIPIYDKTDLGGFYLAVGSSGNQFKNSAVAAHCLTELIRRVEAGHDHDRDPVKVAGRHTGLELDMGAYSRNREINRDSSFSVLG